MKISDRYVHHRNLLRRGQQEIGLYITIFNMAMLFSVFLRTMLHLQGKVIIVLTVLCMVIILMICYAVGWVYNRRKLFESESKWLTARNPDIQDILVTVCDIKKTLERKSS